MMFRVIELRMCLTPYLLFPKTVPSSSKFYSLSPLSYLSTGLPYFASPLTPSFISSDPTSASPCATCLLLSAHYDRLL